MMSNAEIVQRTWDAFDAGEFDALAAEYTEDMIFIMPGQDDLLKGRQAFRTALDGLGDALPPGFEVISIRHIETGNEVVSIVDWKSRSIAASQLAALFRFKGDKIFEERWFVDTEQWNGAS